MKGLTNVWRTLVSLSQLTILSSFMLLLVVVLVEIVSGDLLTEDGAIIAFALLLLGIVLFMLIKLVIPLVGDVVRSIASIFNDKQVETKEEDDPPYAIGVVMWVFAIVIMGSLFISFATSPLQSPITLEMLPSLFFAAFPLAMIILGIDYITRWAKSIFR